MSYIGNQPSNAAFLTDTFSGNGSTVAFTMSVAPANTSSIIVAITGVLQDPSTYSVSGTTLTFSAAPPTGTSNISVRYLGIPASGVTTTAYRTVTNFTATAGQTSFSVPSYTVGYIDVYRNGVRLAAADYTATTGTTVVLASAASAGDSVVTESFYVSSVLNAIAGTSGSVGTTYLADASVTQAKLGTNVAGNGPAFSAYANASQTVTGNVFTKVALQVKSFDTNSCFDNTTNYRFTPNVAGYYQLNAQLFLAGTGTTIQGVLVIYKNGNSLERIVDLSPSASLNSNGNTIFGNSTLVYLNGTTDYVELYGYYYLGTCTFSQNSATVTSRFSGSLVRAA